MNTTAFHTLVIFSFLSCACLAGEKLQLKDLARYEGVWESNPKKDGDSTTLGFNEHRILADYGVKQQIHLEVDQKTKEILSAYIGFVALHPSGEEFHGFVFSSEDYVQEQLTVPTKSGFATHSFYIGGTNGQHLAMLTLDNFVSDSEMRGTQKYTIGAGQFTEEGSISIRKKSQHASLHDLIEKTGIRADKWESRSPHSSLGPLKRLIGHWESKNAEGAQELACLFEYRGGKQWVVERWKFSGGGPGGINVSGIDPSDGELTLWSIGPLGTGKSGRWDELASETLGQVQGTARLVRQFSGSKAFNAHWQDLQKGAFTDRKQASYTAKRVE